MTTIEIKWHATVIRMWELISNANGWSEDATIESKLSMWIEENRYGNIECDEIKAIKIMRITIIIKTHSIYFSV